MRKQISDTEIIETQSKLRLNEMDRERKQLFERCLDLE